MFDKIFITIFRPISTVNIYDLICMFVVLNVAKYSFLIALLFVGMFVLASVICERQAIRMIEDAKD